MKLVLVFLALLCLPHPVGAQVPENVLARLQDPLERERTAAPIALAELAAPDVALLDVGAASLLDEADGVRVTAAHTLAGIVGKLGGKPEFLVEGKALAGVLDAIPKKANRVPLRYPPQARDSGIHGAGVKKTKLPRRNQPKEPTR